MKLTKKSLQAGKQYVNNNLWIYMKKGVIYVRGWNKSNVRVFKSFDTLKDAKICFNS